MGCYNLSKCFGDEPTKEDIETFYSLAANEILSKHIRLEKWYESDDFRKKFQDVLETELELDKNDISKSFKPDQLEQKTLVIISILTTAMLKKLLRIGKSFHPCTVMVTE